MPMVDNHTIASIIDLRKKELDFEEKKLYVGESLRKKELEIEEKKVDFEHELSKKVHEREEAKVNNQRVKVDHHRSIIVNHQRNVASAFAMLYENTPVLKDVANAKRKLSVAVLREASGVLHAFALAANEELAKDDPQRLDFPFTPLLITFVCSNQPLDMSQAVVCPLLRSFGGGGANTNGLLRARCEGACIQPATGATPRPT